MFRRTHRIASLLLALAAGVIPAAATAAKPPANVRKAEKLYALAEKSLQVGSFDARRMAIQYLEQATQQDPQNPTYQLLLARTYYDAGFLGNARHRYEKVAKMMPDDANGRFGLGLTWRRDWLKYLDPVSLNRAIEHFGAAARMRPDVQDPWLKLVPLLVEKDELKEALAAAENGMAAANNYETMIAVAYTSYRLGNVGRADSLFKQALPMMPTVVRERFDDIAPVASAEDTFRLHRMTPEDQVKFIARFWRDNDPDLASMENEALLEYWSRVAHAYFLYYHARRREWDERGEVYVRYGRPRYATYNPVGEALSFRFMTGPSYPMNQLRWEYPELGMLVYLQDRLLSEYYLFPILMDRPSDPQPYPAALANLPGSMATSGGRGVFPKLPPGAKPIPAAGRLARFQGSDGPRLLAQVQTSGGPADSLWAEWVVLDTARAVVAQERRALSVSACEVTEWRVADFARSLPAGRYLVGLTVRDGNGGRGLYREEIELEPESRALAMSDVVVTCGRPLVPPAGAVRIEPNPKSAVGADDPLTAYFEIYHLSQDQNGLARFEFLYTVRSAEKDPRIWIQRVLQPRPKPPAISASRDAEMAGDLRRQFITVPVEELPPGTYRLEITVRDKVADKEATGATTFVKS